LGISLRCADFLRLVRCFRYFGIGIFSRFCRCFQILINDTLSDSDIKGLEESEKIQKAEAAKREAAARRAEEAAAARSAFSALAA
jgi:hypothetical protein